MVVVIVSVTTVMVYDSVRDEPSEFSALSFTVFAPEVRYGATSRVLSPGGTETVSTDAPLTMSVPMPSPSSTPSGPTDVYCYFISTALPPAAVMLLDKSLF